MSDKEHKSSYSFFKKGGEKTTGIFEAMCLLAEEHN